MIFFANMEAVLALNLFVCLLVGVPARMSVCLSLGLRARLYASLLVWLFLRVCSAWYDTLWHGTQLHWRVG